MYALFKLVVWWLNCGMINWVDSTFSHAIIHKSLFFIPFSRSPSFSSLFSGRLFFSDRTMYCNNHKSLCVFIFIRTNTLNVYNYFLFSSLFALRTSISHKNVYSCYVGFFSSSSTLYPIFTFFFFFLLFPFSSSFSESLCLFFHVNFR